MMYENTLIAVRDAEVEASQKYDALVCDTARGKEKDGRDVLEILRLAERSVEEFETDVAWRTERDRQIVEVRQIEHLETTQKTLQAKVNKLYADFQQVEQKYHAEVLPLEAEIRGLRDRITRACNIRSQLAVDCRDTNLLHEMDDINRTQARTRERIRDLDKSTEQLRRDLNNLEVMNQDRSITFAKMLRGDSLNNEIKSLRAKIRKNEREIDLLEIEASELEQRERNVREQMVLA